MAVALGIGDDAVQSSATMIGNSTHDMLALWARMTWQLEVLVVPGAHVESVLAPCAILFDLDDTLIDRPATLGRFADVFVNAYTDHLVPCSAAEIVPLIQAADRSGPPRHSPQSGPDRHDHDVAAALIRLLPWRDVPTADELAAYWTEQLPACTQPVEGLHETFTWLRSRGLPIGIITNGAVERQEPKVEALGLHELVACVTVSDAAGVRKPDRRIFQLALDALGVVPERAWFIGDDPVADVVGATAAGLPAVWFRNGADWPATHPEPARQIDVLGELIPLVDRALSESGRSTPHARAVVPRAVAVGFLYHADSGKVLLHLRAADAPPNAGKWAFFGGRAEPEDGGDLLTTWCREMHEELGVTLDARRAVSLRYGTYNDGTRWHDFYYEWPSLDEDLVLTEGQQYGWFTFDEALDLPDLADYAREDLRLFRERLSTSSNRNIPSL